MSVGGDLYADGEAPEGHGWVVAVADPLEPDRIVDSLAIAKGGVASTWRTKRAWMRDGEMQHHLIDPRTGVPAASGVAGVTVLCGAAGKPRYWRRPRFSRVPTAPRPSSPLTERLV